MLGPSRQFDAGKAYSTGRAMDQKMQTIDVGSKFSRFPAGRLRRDGKFSGEAFREDVLVPALAASKQVEIQLDSALGYGSSFLEEAFGGLVRQHGMGLQEVKQKIILRSNDDLLIEEINQYLNEAAQETLERGLNG